MTGLNLSAGRHNCRVFAPQAVCTFVSEAVAPYFATDNGGSADNWVVFGRCNPSVGIGHEFDDLAGDVTVDPIGRRILIEARGDRELAHAIVRQARHIMKMEAIARSTPVVHAAMVAVGEVGVLIAGAKKAGKTSLALAMLAEPDCTLIANDDVTIHVARNTLYARGWPRSARVRLETLDVLNRTLAARKTGIAVTHPYHTDVRLPLPQAELRSPVLHLSPQDLKQAFTLRAAASVRFIVFPQVAEHADQRILELSSREGMLRLSQVTSPRGELPGQSQMTHLLPHFDPPDEVTASEIVAHASRCQFLEVRHSHSSLANVADRLVGIAKVCRHA